MTRPLTLSQKCRQVSADGVDHRAFANQTLERLLLFGREAHSAFPERWIWAGGWQTPLSTASE